MAAVKSSLSSSPLGECCQLNVGNTCLLGSVSPCGCDLCRAPREEPGGTHLQHLWVIEDLVLVATLSGSGDALGEVGALVQD